MGAFFTNKINSSDPEMYEPWSDEEETSDCNCEVCLEQEQYRCTCPSCEEMWLRSDVPVPLEETPRDRLLRRVEEAMDATQANLDTLITRMSNLYDTDPRPGTQDPPIEEPPVQPPKPKKLRRSRRIRYARDFWTYNH